jgi:LysR family transcriptional regulator, low CO2-responsive transcriptional regulator
VHLQSRVLSPAAEAFRYFILEEGEAYLAEHDRPWMAQAPSGGADRTKAG